MLRKFLKSTFISALTICILLTTSIWSQADMIVDFKLFISGILPLRADGKIAIPENMKHVKLDIGLSHCAPHSQRWLMREDDLVVFGFEPYPASVQSILQESTRQSPGCPVLEKRFLGARFFLIPCALGLSENSIVTFYVTGNDCGCSSLYAPKEFPIERVIEVPIFPLSVFFDMFPFDTHPVIDYIKIDAQGSDLNIAKSAEHYLAEHVIYITLEAEDAQYEGTVNAETDIDAYMRSIGFIRYYSTCTKDPTYLNSRYQEYVKEHEVKIYQHF